TAATQAIPPCRLHERPGTHAIAVCASHVAHVAERDMLAMKRQNHRQTGGTAVRGGQLLHERDLPRCTWPAKPAQRRETVNERLGDGHLLHACPQSQL